MNRKKSLKRCSDWVESDDSTLCFSPSPDVEVLDIENEDACVEIAQKNDSKKRKISEGHESSPSDCEVLEIDCRPVMREVEIISFIRGPKLENEVEFFQGGNVSKAGNHFKLFQRFEIHVHKFFFLGEFFSHFLQFLQRMLSLWKNNLRL